MLRATLPPLLLALACWSGAHPATSQQLLSGTSNADVQRLQRQFPQLLDVAVGCNDVKQFSSPTLDMLRAHFVESSGHFTTVDVPALTQKLGIDTLISKMVCINQAIMTQGFGGQSAAGKFTIDDNETDFLLDHIGQQWSTRDLEAIGKRSPLLQSVSRVEASEGDFRAPGGRRYQFKVVKHHYDFMCTSSISQGCAPVDQVHCIVPSSKTHGAAQLLGRSNSTGACFVRQQPVNLLTRKLFPAAQLQLPLLSMSFANLDPSRALKYSQQPPVARPAMTMNTIPGINDANYTTFVRVMANTTRVERGKFRVRRSAAWRAMPSEVSEQQLCARDGSSVKTTITPEQSINGGFPLAVQESSGAHCLLQLNYFQLQTLANATGLANMTGTAIRGIGRTAATGTCAPGQLPIVRANAAWSGTVPLYNELDSGSGELINDNVCLERLPSYGPSSSGLGRCVLSYCSPLYVPNFAGNTIRVETLDGAENYTRYGDNSWPRNQFYLRNGTGPADGILCDTRLAAVVPLVNCLSFCQKAGLPINSRNASKECLAAATISTVCSRLLGQYIFTTLQYGVEMPGDLTQTGLNTELSGAISRTTANTLVSSDSAVPSYLGQTTLQSPTSMGSDVAPFGCTVDIGVYADALEAQAKSPASAGNKQLGVVQALLNATTSVETLRDENILALVARAREQATLAGQELNAVGVATAIASSVASLAGILSLLQRRRFRVLAFPTRSIPTLGIRLSERWTFLTLPVLLLVIIVLCTVGLLPVGLALKQEIEALNTSAVMSNINSGRLALVMTH